MGKVTVGKAGVRAKGKGMKKGKGRKRQLRIQRKSLHQGWGLMMMRGPVEVKVPDPVP